MFGIITDYFNDFSNYSITNKINMFNFLLKTYDIVEENKKIEFINHLKLIVGLSFFDDFRKYIFRKIPKHEILN